MTTRLRVIYAIFGFMLGLCVTILLGCKTAQKVEPQGDLDFLLAEKECPSVKCPDVTCDFSDYRMAVAQCSQRLQECYEADKDK